MPVDYELTLKAMLATILVCALLLFIVFNRHNSETQKYYHFDDDERDALAYLMSISLTRVTPLEEWKNYLETIGVSEDQFKDLVLEAQEKMLNP